MLQKKCSICDLPILDTDTYIVRRKEHGEIIEETRQNIPIEVKGLPTGFIHIACKKIYDEQMLRTGSNIEDLTGRIKEII